MKTPLSAVSCWWCWQSGECYNRNKNKTKTQGMAVSYIKGLPSNRAQQVWLLTALREPMESRESLSMALATTHAIYFLQSTNTGQVNYVDTASMHTSHPISSAREIVLRYSALFCLTGTIVTIGPDPSILQAHPSYSPRKTLLLRRRV